MTTRNKYSIGQAVRKLSHKVKPQLLLAEVKSVNKQTGKLTVDCAFLGLENVKIDYHPATSSGNQYILYPAVGSMVVVGRLEGSDQLFVLSVIVPDEVWLRGGEWTTVRGDEAEREMKKLNSNINLLQQATRALAVVLDGLVMGTSVAFDTAMSAKQSQVLTDFKNEKVKHG